MNQNNDQTQPKEAQRGWQEGDPMYATKPPKKTWNVKPWQVSILESTKPSKYNYSQVKSELSAQEELFCF